MGVAGPVPHAQESEVGGVIVMEEDAIEVLVDMSLSAGDAPDGQQWGIDPGRRSCR